MTAFIVTVGLILASMAALAFGLAMKKTRTGCGWPGCSKTDCGDSRRACPNEEG